jgi:hypothetical protein
MSKIGRIEEKTPSAQFSLLRGFAVQSTYNGTRDCGAFGPLGRNAESVSYVLSMVWGSSNPSFRASSERRTTRHSPKRIAPFPHSTIDLPSESSLPDSLCRMGIVQETYNGCGIVANLGL